MGSSKLLESATELAPPDWTGITTLKDGYGFSSGERTLGDYWRILRKRKWTIIASLAVVVTAGAIISLTMTPIYDAVARISISSYAPSILHFKDDQQYADPMENQDLLIATQVNILQSNTLALLVIHNLGLNNRPEFAGKQRPNITGGVPLSGLSAQTLEREDQLIRVFRSSLNVSSVPSTAIIEIKYSSRDPRLAAEIANATADTFIEQDVKARFSSAMQAADWLSKQLDDLQIKVETSQARLIEYQKLHGIVGTDDKQNLTFEKLNELGRQLTQSQADRIQKESLYQIAKGANPGALASVLQDPALSTLAQQKVQLQIQYAQLTTQFGSSYPKVLEIQNQLSQISKAYQEELQNGELRVQNEYYTAVKREQMLKAALNDQTAVANQLNENAIEYTILKQEADSNRQLYDGLLEKLKEASLAAGLHSSNVRIVDKARVPLLPARPSVRRNMLFALLLGLASGVAGALALEAADNTVRTPEQAQVLGLPVMAAIPLKASLNGAKATGARFFLAPRTGNGCAATLVTSLEPQSQISEAYRTLRTSILLSRAGQPPQVVVFTSALPQEGKTMTSVNTAFVIAKQGKRVLLIDADLRRPSIHKVLELRSDVGLSNVLSGGAKWKDAVQPTAEANLFVLPSGPLPPHPSELLAATSMQDLIREGRNEYDHIIIDSPPLLSVTDAVLLAVQADMVALVVRSGQTTMGAIRNARDLLLHVKAPLRGIVLNAVDLQSPDYYYYHSGPKYRGYYTDKDAPKLKGGRNGASESPDGDEQQKTSDAAKA
ncbi:MAG: polysaccharide biosynthesis tyrosine autokinase [Candidatus Korobacteraceae bacterium]|jgi:capsular exopolysaccharide synthesis family protein